MDTEYGIAAVTNISIGVFFLSSCVFGFIPIASEPAESDEEMENYRKNPVGGDPMAGQRAYMSAVFMNGAPTGMVISVAFFNLLFPAVNVIGQAGTLSWVTFKPHTELFLASMVVSSITFSSMIRLAKAKDALDMPNKPTGDKASLWYFIVRQYVIYNLAIAFEWFHRGDESNTLQTRVILFAVVLTVDDWNVLAKYLRFIPKDEISRVDLTKMMCVAIIVPLVMIISLLGRFSFRVFSDSNSLYVYFGMAVVTTFLIMWYQLIAEYLKMIRESRRW